MFEAKNKTELSNDEVTNYMYFVVGIWRTGEIGRLDIYLFNERKCILSNVSSNIL